MEANRLPKNAEVLNDETSPSWLIINNIKNLLKLLQPDNSSASISANHRLVCWKPPTDHWFKLNTDGSSLGNRGFANISCILSVIT